MPDILRPLFLRLEAALGRTNRVLAVANQKGGVGKTTTVINLGASLGALGGRVLLVDCDPQANTSSGLTASSHGDTTIYEVLTGDVEIADAILKTASSNVDLIPASNRMVGLEIELLDAADRESVLKSRLNDIVGNYDYVLLDCPPSLGILTVNALVAADAVIVPVQCEYLALEGLAGFMETVERIRLGLNPSLEVFGVLMTMFDRRTVLSDQVAKEVRDHYPDLTFRTVIPRSVRLSEAPSFGKSIIDYDPTSRGAEAYASLALEVATRG